MKYAGDYGIGYIAVVSCICDDIGVRYNKKNIDHIALNYIEHTTRWAESSLNIIHEGHCCHR
jgi:hypothetical protein